MEQVIGDRTSASTWSRLARADGRDTVRDGPTRYRRPPTQPRVRADGPATLGAYQLIEVLGEGGMARVFRARHAILGKQVAIKMLLPHLLGVDAAHALFVREARIAGAIRHPHLVDVYDFAIDCRGRPYCVMELAVGETLAQRLARGPLLLSQCLDVAIGVCEAVVAVHAAGYVHRDIKSENVLLAGDDRRVSPKLIDFGIAKRLDDDRGDDELAEMVGTPRTMAPEQVARDAVDERTDIWGLGVLLYEMLTGHLPFPGGDSLRDELIAIVTEPPIPLPVELGDDIRAVVDSCLRKDPDDRPRSARALADRLAAIRDDYVARHDLIERALVADEAWRVVIELEAEGAGTTGSGRR